MGNPLTKFRFEWNDQKIVSGGFSIAMSDDRSSKSRATKGPERSCCPLVAKCGLMETPSLIPSGKLTVCY